METKIRSLPLFLREIWRDYKGMLILIFALAIFQGLAPLINIILPKYILDELLGMRRLNSLLLYIGGLALGNFIFYLAISICKNNLIVYTEILSLDASKKLAAKSTSIGLEDSEKKTNLDLIERGRYGAYEIARLAETISIIGSALVTVLTVIGILIRNDWRLILIVLLCNLATIPCFNKLKELDIDNARRGVPENRAFQYLCSVATDFRFAKDLRIYNGDKFFLEKAKTTMDKIININHEYFTKHGFWNGIAQSIVQIQLTLIFIVLGLGLLGAKISVGTFTMLYNASNQLGRSINSLIQGYTDLVTLSFNLDPYYEFLNLKDMEEDGKKLDSLIERPVSISFEDVSFKYPTGDKELLKDLSFHIYPGETLAIVGRNGGGKTTIIKLLSRLYKPQKGRILINGLDIQSLSLEEYRRELSVVFQDFKLLPIKLNENIIGKAEGLISEKEIQDIWNKLDQTGIKSWIKDQSKGLSSYITKIYDDRGLLPSGGQEQKIAIARALARDGSIVILDEPTAALDPKSEEEVYENLIKLTEGKTSIFISHRLSSTRIADRIIVIDDGKIVEEGSHKQLMELRGLYTNMFKIQARQYIN